MEEGCGTDRVVLILSWKAVFFDFYSCAIKTIVIFSQSVTGFWDISCLPGEVANVFCRLVIQVNK